MARPRRICDEDILAAARAVFLEHGLQASTAQIAERAGISEGSLFRRFPNKDAILLASMRLSDTPTWVALAPTLVGQHTIRANIETLATAILTFFRQSVPCIHLMLASHLSPISFMRGMTDPPPVRGIKSLAAYFQAEQDLGRIRQCDPEIAARMLTASLHQYVVFELAGVNDRMPMPATTLIRSVSDMLVLALGALDPPDPLATSPGHMPSDAPSSPSPSSPSGHE